MRRGGNSENYWSSTWPRFKLRKISIQAFNSRGAANGHVTGADMLKKHQCTIDLKKNCLVIGTTGTETPSCQSQSCRLVPDCHQVNVRMSSKPLPKKQQHLINNWQKAIARSDQTAVLSDTSESNSEKAGTSGTSSTPAAAAVTSDILPTDSYQGSRCCHRLPWVPRAGCITELREEWRRCLFGCGRHVCQEPQLRALTRGNKMGERMDIIVI